MKNMPREWMPLDGAETKMLGAIYSADLDCWQVPEEAYHLANSYVEKAGGFGWCKKCGSYCYGDCDA